ncbi:MAG: hypothetical protein ACKV0T_10840, partial [Planctomycetales bacterium]
MTVTAARPEYIAPPGVRRLHRRFSYGGETTSDEQLRRFTMQGYHVGRRRFRKNEKRAKLPARQSSKIPRLPGRGAGGRRGP